MASIVEIKRNDSLDRIIEKANDNFRSLYSARSNMSASTVVIEQTNDASKRYIDSTIEVVKDDLSLQVTREVSAAENKLSTKLFDLAYPIGSIIFTVVKNDTRLSNGKWVELKNMAIFNSITPTVAGSSGKFYAKKTVTDAEKAGYTEISYLNGYIYQRIG